MSGPRAAAHKRAEPGRPRPAGLQAPRPDEGGGIPLAVLLTGGNRNDVIGLEPLLDAVRTCDESLYNVYKDPTQSGIGQVSESWGHLQDLIQGRVDTPTRHLVWLSDVLRALGTPVTRKPLTPES